MSEASPSSHRQILKSTSVIGGSTVINVLIGVGRTKILAVLLGPSGIALFGLYGSALALISTLSRLGITSSGVRQIAEASGKEDRKKISQTIVTLRRVVLVTGILGAVVVLLLSPALSRLTFGDTSHTGAFSLLSLSVLFGTVSAGQGALIQGLRLIRALATIKVMGAIFGVVVTVPLVYVFRDRGVAISIVAASAMAALVSWLYSRRVPVEPIVLSWRDLGQEARGLIGLGLAFMVSATTAAGVIYLIRALIVRQLGLDAAGYYQAAFGLAGVYVGIILGAMGADFYPRLTAAARDNPTCNRLVNEQSEVGLLLAGPGVVATLVLAPVVIRIFYSADFLPAVEVLRWQILGVFGRVISWPLSYTILAKGRGRLFVAAETASNAVHAVFVFAGLRIWGLPGAGIAFFAFYVCYSIMMRIVVGRLSGFRWTREYLRLLIVYSLVIFAVFLVPLICEKRMALAIGCLLTASTGAYSAQGLYRLLGREYVWTSVRKIAASVGIPVRS